jgi:hypothetical protein
MPPKRQADPASRSAFDEMRPRAETDHGDERSQAQRLHELDRASVCGPNSGPPRMQVADDQAPEQRVPTLVPSGMRRLPSGMTTSVPTMAADHDTERKHDEVRDVRRQHGFADLLRGACDRMLGPRQSARCRRVRAW